MSCDVRRALFDLRRVVDKAVTQAEERKSDQGGAAAKKRTRELALKRRIDEIPQRAGIAAARTRLSPKSVMSAPLEREETWGGTFSIPTAVERLVDREKKRNDSSIQTSGQ